MQDWDFIAGKIEVDNGSQIVFSEDWFVTRQGADVFDPTELCLNKLLNN